MSEDFIADMDQQRARIKVVAPLFGDYFKALCGQGFERSEALELVRDYQGEFLAAGDDE